MHFDGIRRGFANGPNGQAKWIALAAGVASLAVTVSIVAATAGKVAAAVQAEMRRMVAAEQHDWPIYRELEAIEARVGECEVTGAKLEGAIPTLQTAIDVVREDVRDIRVFLMEG